MNETYAAAAPGAILVADVAGYSRLMSCDERGTVAALDDARAVFRDDDRCASGPRHRHGRRLGARGVRDRERRGRLRRWRSSAELARGSAERRRGLPDALSHRRPSRRRDGEGRRHGLRRRRQHRRAARRRSPSRAASTVSEPVQCAVRQRVDATLRRPRRAARQEHRRAGARLSRPASAPRRRAAPAPRRRAATPPAPPAPQRERADKPSIAVLPFDNMSGDPEQEFFADGITEDIITELSRFRELFVISRNSSFKFKGKPVEVQKFARELGVQYVVEGSVRKVGQAGAHHGAADRRRDRPPRLGRALRPRPRGHLRDPGRGDDGDRRDAARPRRGGGARPRRAARRPTTWPPTSACSPARCCTTAATARTTRGR